MKVGTAESLKRKILSFRAGRQGANPAVSAKWPAGWKGVGIIVFQNNNQEIVGRLARRSFRADKRKNRLSVLTVAIAVGMMTALALLPAGALQSKKAEEAGTPQATFGNVSPDAVSKLKNASEVEWFGEQVPVASVQTGDSTIRTAYCDRAMLKASKRTLKGAMPVRPDEILLEQSFLTHIRSQAKPGDSIALDLGEGEKEYRLTGVLAASSQTGRSFTAIVSRAYVQKRAAAEAFPINAYVRIRNAAELSDDDFQRAVYSLADRAGVPKDSVSIATSEYRVQKQNSASGLLGLAAVAVIILLGAAIVIYSIFYISVTGRVHEYGQLRTIGTTKKQIRSVVYREGLFICGVGIPAGLIIGGIVGYFLVPKGWSWANTLWIAAAVCLIGLLSVWLSIRTPVRMAANTAPIEAVRFMPYEEKARRKKSRRITPFRLAVTSLSRNRKKFVLTLLSLGFSGILLSCVATMAVSYSAADDAKAEFPYGSYKISLSAQNMGDGDFAINRIQADNPLNRRLKEELLSIKGVKEIREWSSTEMRYKLPNGRDSGGAVTVYAFSADEISKMKPYLTAGKLDYPSMASRYGIAVCFPQVYKEAEGWTPRLGDSVAVTLLGGKGETVERTFTVTALLSGNYRQAGPALWMPADAMNGLAGMNTVSHFEVVTDGRNQAETGRQLKSVAEKNPYLAYESLEDTTRAIQKEMQPGFHAMYILSAFLVLFGLINLVNTSVTNLLARGREIGTLQAVGLSGRQLNRMLQTEGLLYTAGTAAFTLTVGTAFGYFVYRILKKLGMSLHYHYPVIPICLFIAVLLFVQLIISALTVQNLKRHSLVERIKEGE